MTTKASTKAAEEIRAADIAKALGVSPREARIKLRAAGLRAPYAEKDVPKMKAVIKGDAPAKPKAATGKPSKAKPAAKAKAPSVADSTPVEAIATVN